MEFSFFTEDNKSGYKTRESWFSKNYPTEYKKILEYSEYIPTELSFKEKIYFYYKNLKERPKCVTCQNEIKFRERFDPNKTEKEIMLERKYYRIYDCGNVRWEYNI